MFCVLLVTNDLITQFIYSVDSFKELKDHLINVTRNHYTQQRNDFSEDDEAVIVENSHVMTSLDLVSSTSMNNNIKLRNGLQKEVGSLSTYWKGNHIDNLRKRKKNGHGKNIHLPTGNIITPSSSVRKKKETVSIKSVPSNLSICGVLDNKTGGRFSRNGLEPRREAPTVLHVDSDVDSDDEVIVESPPKKTKHEEHVEKVKMKFLEDLNSPVEPFKVKVYQKNC